MRRITLLAAGCLVLVMGCASPEATRQRGGRGGDPGNRAVHVRMHEGSRQYWKTPVSVPGGGPPLEPSEQARRISLSSTR